MKNITTEQRIAALAEFLEVDADELSVSSYDDKVIEHGSSEYKVVTDEEADQAAEEYIKESLWAFNASFISSHTKNGLSDRAEKALEKMQGELCESANDIIEAMIEDLDQFVQDAISSDGRGHFLASYDGDEDEQGEFYIYRMN